MAKLVEVWNVIVLIFCTSKSAKRCVGHNHKSISSPRGCFELASSSSRVLAHLA